MFDPVRLLGTVSLNFDSDPKLVRGPRQRSPWPLFRSRACSWALVLTGLCRVTHASAQETGPPEESQNANLDLARSVAVTGREAFNAGDYETALTLFRRAYTLYPAPTVVLYEARTLEKMGLLVEAVLAYSRTTELPMDSGAPARFAQAIAAAEQEGRDLRARIPSLTVQVEGASQHDPNLKVVINGRAIGAAQFGQAQSLNPGTYSVSGSLSSERTDQDRVVLAVGENRTVVLDLALPSLESPAPGAGSASGSGWSPPRRIPLLAYLAGGVGVAGVGTGLITGMLANAKYSEAERECENQLCMAGTRGPSAVSAFRTLRMVSSVSYGVGAAGIAAGVVLWLTGSDDSEAGRVGSIEPWGTVDTAGVRGTF